MSALFKRKTQASTVAPASAATEPSLLDFDDPAQSSSIAAPAPTMPAKTSAAGSSTSDGKASFLNWSGSGKSKPTLPLDKTSISRSQSPKAGIVSPLNPSIASPRISTSSRTSIFERSVDSIPSDNVGALVDPTHSQLIVDNQIPSVLDASVEAITSNEDLSKVEIVTAQPTLTPAAENLSVPALPNPWSEEENISTAHVPIHQGKRLSFVSYADLLGVEQAEAEANSLYSQKSGDSRPLSPDSIVPSRPQSTPVEAAARRQKSVVTLTGSNPDLELTRTSMADTLLAPTQTFENVNPWA